MPYSLKFWYCSLPKDTLETIEINFCPDLNNSSFNNVVLPVPVSLLITKPPFSSKFKIIGGSWHFFSCSSFLHFDNFALFIVMSAFILSSSIGLYFIMLINLAFSTLLINPAAIGFKPSAIL